MRAYVLAALTGAGLVLAACLPQPGPATPDGAADFAANCAGCHGAGGRGDGPDAAALGRRPADLTRLSSRTGGDFPTTRVMAKIWGYAGGRGAANPMPAFGPLLDSALVPYDGGDGIQTPTPIRLVQIAEYIQTLQR